MASTSIPSRWKYDVFVSFRGDDIRKSFMDHLYKDLELKGIRAFRDGHLPRGEEISSQLFEAIQESRFLMVIFSKNYASSTWCLRELVKILDCKRRGKREHDVMVIFYDIRPDVVRKQTKSYAKAFAKHQFLDRTEVAKWKEALSMAANLCGLDLESDANGHESKLIDMISETILCNLHGHLHVKNHLMSVRYDVCCFDADIEGVAKLLGLPHVQRRLINYMEEMPDLSRDDVHQGTMMSKNKVANRQTLLVILGDGIDNSKQLEALTGSHDWSSAGSSIILTSKSGLESMSKMTPLRNQSEHQIRQLRKEVHELQTFCQEIRQEIGNIHQMVSEQSKMMCQMMARFQHLTFPPSYGHES